MQFCNCRLYLNSGMVSQIISLPTYPLLTFTDIYPGTITPAGVLMCITNTCLPITRQNCYRDYFQFISPTNRGDITACQ